MHKTAAALVIMFCTPAGRADAAWWTANFHAHAANSAVADDGSESPETLHAVCARRGFHFSAHTPHSTLAGPAGESDWRRQRAVEAALGGERFTVTVGQELTVAPGPAWRAKTRVLGHDAPGNLDHLSLIGADRFVPSGTPLAAACRAAHDSGGVCIVNHPGPGPMMWEEGLWEAPAERGAVDALEVYNGQALAATGIDFEARYREATAYRGLAMKIAAVTGADTHGPASVARARARLHGFGQAALVLEAMAPPATADDRPELDAATLVEAPSPSLPQVVAALRARRTVATYRMGELAIDCPGLGEVRRTGAVKLHLGLGRPVAEVTLYREGEAVRRWQGVATVDFAETRREKTAYVFAARDGAGRLLTSAIWFEP